jgi:branched-chain amino acid transport system ATP-binding protein
MTAILRSEGLNKHFGAVSAAADVNLNVDEGEVVALIGANGAGKTTFVNMVTGYLRPDTGRIRLGDRDLVGLTPRQVTRAGICRSFQVAQLFPELTVLDNILIALAIARGGARSGWKPVRRPDWIDASDEVLGQFELAEHRDAPAGTLAQGVRKLLDIAMATVASPRLIMLDEPTSGISVDEKFAVMDTLMNALRQRGVTVLFVEHDMEIVERYAQRVVAFYDGRILADGQGAEVLDDPEVRQYVVGGQLHRRGTLGGGCLLHTFLIS